MVGPLPCSGLAAHHVKVQDSLFGALLANLQFEEEVQGDHYGQGGMLLDYDIVKTIYINFKLSVFNPQNPFFQCKKDYQIRRESEMIKFQSIYLFSVFIELGHIYYQQ